MLRNVSPRIRSLLVSKTFTNFVDITYPVLSLPSANFVAAVITRQIRQRANTQLEEPIMQRSFDRLCLHIVFCSIPRSLKLTFEIEDFTPFVNTHTNGYLQYHVAVETLTNYSDGSVSNYFQSMREEVTLKKYIKTVQINLREWQKWQQLLIQ